MRNKKKVLIITILLILTVAAFLWKKKQVFMSGGFKTPVEAVLASKSVLEEKIFVVGNISSSNSITVTTEITGKIKNIIFKDGEEVSEGQELVKLDSDTYQSNINYAKATLNLAQLEADRQKVLFDKKVVSKQAYDEAIANLKKDQASLDIALEQYEKTSIKSPVKGIIGIRYVNKGDLLSVGSKIATIQDSEGIEVNMQISDIYINKIKIGTEVELESDIYPGEVFKGKLTAIDPQIDEVSRQVRAKARVVSNGKKLYPGGFGKITIILDKRDALMVSDSAIFKTVNGDLIYKIAEGKVEFQLVKIGIRDKEKVEIIDGIKEGDQIITAGHLKLAPGAEVQVINQEKQEEKK